MNQVPPVVDIDVDIEALRTHMQNLLMVSALCGDAMSLLGPLEELRELIDDTLLDLDDEAAPATFAGWATEGYTPLETET